VVLPETGGVIKRAMDELWALVQKEGLELAGDCYCAYPIPKGGEVVPVDSVIPVREAKAGGQVQSGEQHGGLVAYTHHVGPYSEIPAATQAVYTWIQANGYEIAGPLREIYLESGATPKTEIAFPIVRP